MRFPDEFRHSRHGALLDGFSLHAGVRIHGNDHDGRERLCRYLLRPPLSLQRLSQGEESRLVHRMRRPRGGSLFLLLTPDELLARLATLVPPPRVHGFEVPWRVRAELQGEEKGRAGRAGPRPGSFGDSGEDDGEGSSPELCVNRTHGEAPRLLHAASATTASFDFSRDMSK